MLATFHIVWTTHGTWLPGDRRGWVKKSMLGIQEPDSQREATARRRMAEQAVVLNLAQRTLVEQTIRDHCQIRKWPIHALNIRSNHIHIVVSGDRDADQVMNQLKAWCSRKLSDESNLDKTVAAKAGRRHWFTEGGNKELIPDDAYFHNAIRYVLDGQ